MTMTPPAQPIRLYRFRLSGHSHRAELFLSLLGLPFEKIEVDLTRGEQKTPEHLKRNLFAQVPVIEDGGITIADSNAILTYLALRYDDSGRWLPRDPVQSAQVQRWLSAAAGPLVLGPARARAAVIFNAPADPRGPEITKTMFSQMETHLQNRHFFVGDHPTIADIALYTYTSHAPEGGNSLQPYPALRAWLARIEALPGYVSMQRHPAVEATPV